MAGWMQNYHKPKGDFSEYSFDIEILVPDENGRKQSRIIRGLKYDEKGDYFEEYGTKEKHKRFDISQWYLQVKVPCNNCQGGGCTTCNGYGYWLQ